MPGISPENLLELDSRSILESIEVQHGLLVERAQGIWSFSHLAFQEYFVSKHLCDSADWSELSTRIFDKRWREVFLLVSKEIVSADELFKAINLRINNFIKDQSTQSFLLWIHQKSQSISTVYNPTAVRIFYFTLVFSHAIDLIMLPKVDSNLAYDLNSRNIFRTIAGFDQALALVRSRELILDLLLDQILETLSIDSINRCITLSSALDLKLQQILEALREQQINYKNSVETKTQFLLSKENNIQEIRNYVIKHRNFAHVWEFDRSQERMLRLYYYANHLLIDCLHSSSSVSYEVRQEIEDTLLLPIAEIEKRKQQ